jgi:iduronate 2-sulfatase
LICFCYDIPMEKPNTTKFVIVLFLAFTLLGFTGIAGAADPQLNVLFLAIDDMKPLLGCYGDEVAITPNIDTLAVKGRWFE